jgi:hypothetical protein
VFELVGLPDRRVCHLEPCRCDQVDQLVLVEQRRCEMWIGPLAIQALAAFNAEAVAAEVVMAA